MSNFKKQKHMQSTQKAIRTDMRILYRAQNGLKTNIDIPTESKSSNGFQTQSKEQVDRYTFIPSEGPNVLDIDIEKNYNDYREELDRLAKDWIELLLNGILENRNNSFPALDKKWH